MARGYFPGGGDGSAGSDEVTASSAQVLKGYTAITTDSNDEPMEGTIPSKAAQTYNVSASNQEISAGQYLSGKQTIRAVTTSNLTAANIRKNVRVTVGDSANASRIRDVTGSYSTVSGKTAAGAAQILSGYAAFANGSNQINGSIPLKAAATYTPGTSDQSIAKGYYLNGVQTIKGDANLVAANIVSGKKIFGVTGSASKYGTWSGNLTPSTTTTGYTSWYNNTQRTSYYNYVTKQNLGFTPILAYAGGSTGDSYNNPTNTAKGWAGMNLAYRAGTDKSGIYEVLTGGNISMTSTNMTLPTYTHGSTTPTRECVAVGYY